eukprot:COSAG01_NODE_35679_length_528_cov_1.081585_2_plen_138_part_01
MTRSRYPITVRAGVDSGDISSASGSRFALHGIAQSSWSASTATPKFVHNITLPGNAVAKVMIPAHDSRGADVLEAGRAVVGGGVTGVIPIGVELVNKISYLAMSVGSGSYHFTSSWRQPPYMPPTPAPAPAPAPSAV